MHISIIVATDENNGIGIKGSQPAFISEDLKRFKALTTGNTIVMGRRTFEALPKGALPNRRNIVITRNSNFQAPRCEIISDPNKLENICADDEKIFVIGGGEIYKAFLPKAQSIYLTLIHNKFDGIDTWFPPIGKNQWKAENTEGPFSDKKNNLSFSYINYIRKNSPVSSDV
jgi:dihydrofolate reductase